MIAIAIMITIVRWVLRSDGNSTLSCREEWTNWEAERNIDIDGVFEVGGFGVRIFDFLDIRNNAFHNLFLDECMRCHLNLL